MSEKTSHFVFLDGDYESVNRRAIRSTGPDWLLIKKSKMKGFNWAAEYSLLEGRNAERRMKGKKNISPNISSHKELNFLNFKRFI